MINSLLPDILTAKGDLAMDKILDTVEKRGVEKGENKLGLLMKKLFAVKRYADADEAATDEIKRNQLYREFGIQ